MGEWGLKATGLSRVCVGCSIGETSWFAEGEGSIQPHQYRSTDGLSSDHDTIDLDFDWHSNEVTGLIDGEEFQAALEGEVHDRVSLQYGLMYDLLMAVKKRNIFFRMPKNSKCCRSPTSVAKRSKCRSADLMRSGFSIKEWVHRV